MGDFLSSFVMYFLTRKSAGTPTRDLEFGREVGFPFVSSLLGNFARGGLHHHPSLSPSPRIARATWWCELIQLPPFPIERRKSQMKPPATQMPRLPCTALQRGASQSAQYGCTAPPSMTACFSYPSRVRHYSHIFIVVVVTAQSSPARKLDPAKEETGRQNNDHHNRCLVPELARPPHTPPRTQNPFGGMRAHSNFHFFKFAA